MGRRARPVELLVLTGKKHLTKREKQLRSEAESSLRPALSELVPPAWLDERARAEWERVVALMAGTGVLTDLDVNTLAVYCDASVRYAEAAARVQREGAIVDGPRGPMQSPAVLVAEKYWRIMNAAARALGLDPTSRAALARAKAAEQPEDEFARVFGG